MTIIRCYDDMSVILHKGETQNFMVNVPSQTDLDYIRKWSILVNVHGEYGGNIKINEM